MDSEQEKAIKEIIDIAKQNNLEVIFVETPKYMSVMENSAYQRAMEEYEELLKQEDINMYWQKMFGMKKWRMPVIL